MDDYVRRNVAIKSLYNEIIKRRLLDDVNDGMLDEFDTESILQKVPSEDVQPSKPGQLIGIEYDGFADGNPVYTEWQCSECGCIFEGEDIDFNFCPNCGVPFKKVNKHNLQN